MSVTSLQSTDDSPTPATTAVGATVDAPRSSMNLPLVAILLVGLLLRMAALAWWLEEPIYIVDETDYDVLAVNLVEHGEFSMVPGSLSSTRPPLYPAFLAGIYQVAGVRNYMAVRLVQLALGLLLVLQVYWLARPMYGEQVALVAAGIASCYPSFVVYPNLVLTELLFSTLLMAAFLGIARFFRGGSAIWLALSGIYFGLATLTRSVLWPFAPVLALYFLFTTRGQSWPRRIAIAAVPALAFVLTLAPWAVRNTRLQQAFTVVDVMGGRNLMMGNYEFTPLMRSWTAIQVHDDESLGPDRKVAWDVLMEQEHPGYSRLTQGQRDKLAMRRGLKFMVENPGLTLLRDTVKFFNFWQLEREIVAGFAFGWWGKLSTGAIVAITAVIFGAYSATLLAGVFGFVVCPPADRRLHWLLLLVVGFVCALHTVVFAHSRYHLAVMPIVFVYAGAAVVHFRTIVQQRGMARFWIASAICLLLAASWVFEIAYTDLDRFRTLVLH